MQNQVLLVMIRLILLSLAMVSSVHANPWLLPPGTVVVSGRYDYSYASEEYLANDGTLNDYSLDGAYQASTYTLGARIGINEFFELEISLPLKAVSYAADPLILLPSEENGEAAFDYYQENIINFNQTTMGFGDLQVASRYRMSVYPIASSLELKLIAPTGYQQPEGTFGTSPSDIDDFVERAGELVKPENIRDDVTLGDGVFVFQPLIHLGYGTASGFFTRLSIGLQFRNQDAGELFTSEFKLGQLINKWFLVYGGIYMEKTVIPGRSIGVSVASIDPSLPASEYIGLKNLKPIIVNLDRDLLVLPLGILVKPTPTVDLTFSYTSMLWGRNVSKSHTVSVGVNIASNLL